MEQEKEKSDHRMRCYIRITDADMWGKIDKIMTVEKYSKSFNKVINDALYYGLDELLRQLFEQVEIVEGNIKETKLVRKVDGLNEEYFWELARLVREVVVNVTINKSILSSLFNAKADERNEKPVNGKKFAEGRYGETPEYLSDYEMRGLRDLRH